MTVIALPSTITPSPFWKLEPGPSEVMVIVFSHLNEPEGRFSLYGSVRDIPATKLFINSRGNCWYRDGVPGLGRDIEETATSLRAIVGGLAPRVLVTVGLSMGGYAAILFGALLGATRVLALSAKTLLTVPGSLSHRFLAGRPVSAYDDLGPFIETAAGRTNFHLLAGEGDVVDLHAAHRMAHLPNVTVGTVPDGAHEAARALNDAGAFVPLLDAFVQRGEVPADCPAGRALSRDRAAIPWLYLGHLHLEAGRIHAAEQALRHCLTLAPELHAAHALLGRLLNQRRDLTAAEHHLRRAVAAAPLLPDYHQYLGVTLAGLGRHCDAEEQQRLALSRDPRNAAPHLHLGVALAEQGRWAEAEQALRDAVGFNPKAAYGWHRLGLVLAVQQRPEDAEAAQRQAIQVSPSNANFHLHLGHALSAQGRQAEAIKSYEAAIRVNPDNPGLKTHLEKARLQMARAE